MSDILNRRKEVYSKNHGRLNSNDESIKGLASSHSAENEAIEFHKKLGREAKRATSLDKLRQNAKDIDNSTKFMKTLSETAVYKADAIKDKPIPVSIFEKMLIKINPGFFIHRNMDVRAKNNGQGHEIYFMRHGIQPIFVTGVGEVCELIIFPETKFSTDKKGGKEFISHKGWLGALDMVIKWSEEHKISNRSKIKNIIK